MKIPFAQFGDETPLGRQVRFLGEQLKKFSESQIDGFNVKSSFIGAGLAFSAQTATTPKVLSVSGVTADLLPSSIVYNNQDNTYTSGTQDFSLTNLIVPIHLDNRPPKKGEIWLHPGDGSLKIRDGRTTNNQTHNIEFQDNKSVPGGYPSLDVNGDVPLAQMNPNVAQLQGNNTWTGNHSFERASLTFPRKNYNPNSYQRGEVWINNGQSLYVSDEVIPNLHTLHDNKNTITWDDSFSGTSILGNSHNTLLMQAGANQTFVLASQDGVQKLLLGTGGTVNFYGGSTLAGQINANGHWGIGTTNDDAAMFEINSNTASLHGLQITMGSSSTSAFGVLATSAASTGQAVVGEVSHVGAIAGNFVDLATSGARTNLLFQVNRSSTWSGGGTDSVSMSSLSFNPTVSATASWSGKVLSISHTSNTTAGTLTSSGTLLNITHAPTAGGGSITDTTTGLSITMTPVTGVTSNTGLSIILSANNPAASIGGVFDTSASNNGPSPIRVNTYATTTGLSSYTQPVVYMTSIARTNKLVTISNTFTFSGGSSGTASSMLPANFICIGMQANVTTVIASARTYQVGDGTTPGRWIAAGTSGSVGVTFGWVAFNPALAGLTTSPVCTVATDVVVTLSGTAASGVITVTFWGFLFS